MLKRLSQYALLFAWLISLVAFLATQYSSEILNMPVCPLCWYQRVCLYPLLIILAIAAYRNDRQIAIYAGPLALLGALFAFYQYLEQMIPGFAPINLCRASGVDCSQIHLKVFGFITYPLLSIIASLVIFTLLLIAKTNKNPNTHTL